MSKIELSELAGRLAGSLKSMLDRNTSQKDWSEYQRGQQAVKDFITLMSEQGNKATTSQDRKPEWRQPTPQMQLQAVLSALMGHLLNLKEGAGADIETLIAKAEEAMTLAKLNNLHNWVSGWCGLHENAEPCARCAVYSRGGG